MLLASPGHAGDDPVPDEQFFEFLEYLGSWEEGEEEWVELIDVADEREQRDDSGQVEHAVEEPEVDQDVVS